MSNLFQRLYDALIPQEMYDFYIELLKTFIGEDSIVIDCGCGSGRLTSQLEMLTHHIFAFDHDKHMIEIAKQKTRYTTYHVMDMHESWPFYGDVILMSLDVINFSKNPYQVLKHATQSILEHGVIVLDMYNPKAITSISEQGIKPFPYTWHARIEHSMLTHELKIENESHNIIQYIHEPNDIIQYMKTLGFNGEIKQSIDIRKHILIFYR